MLKNFILLQSLIQNIDGSEVEDVTQKVESISKEVDALKTMSFDDILNRLIDSTVSLAMNIAIALVVFYAGRFILRKIYKIVASIFVSRNVDRSLSSFVLSLLNIMMYFILIVTVIGILGIETSSFLALFASAGVAIGMALSGTLQNFAGGVLILLLKPYKIGDYIEAQGYAGTVKEIQIFFTVITTPDNKSISIPNGGLSTASVNNWTRENYRRVSWTVSIAYGDNVEAARQAILAMFATDKRVLTSTSAEHNNELATANSGSGSVNGAGDDDIVEKRSFIDRLLCRHRRTRAAIAQWGEKRDERLAAMQNPVIDFTPKVLVGELGSSSVDLTVRAWTLTSDYWNVFFEYNERFYNELPGHGINFPFPQLDVHLPAK
jgi:small conductance mechanosensitive channel